MDCALGDFGRALAAADQTVVLCQELGNRGLLADAVCMRGNIHAARGDAAPAVASYREAIDLYRETGRPTMPPEPLAGLVRLALARAVLKTPSPMRAKSSPTSRAAAASTARRIRR